MYFFRNLQAALGSYYDLGSGGDGGMSGAEALMSTQPAMIFVQDVTIGEGESVPPNTRFIKTWRLRNPGVEAWPMGSYLKHIEGSLLAGTDMVLVPCVGPNQEGDVSVEMMSPGEGGIYQSRWQLNTPSGVPFGGQFSSIFPMFRSLKQYSKICLISK